MYSHHKNKLAAPSKAALDLKMPLQPLYQLENILTFDTKSGFKPSLSSLADAPPLTSGGKTSGSLSKDGRNVKVEHKTTASKSGTKEASRLSLSSALDYLPEDGMRSKSSAFLKSFTADGRKAPFSQRSVRFDLDDNSDEATHYSYEETDYDGEELPEMGGDLAGFMSDKLVLMDASQLSPILSSAGSPEPAAVNSLVKLGAQCSENNMGQLEALSKHFLHSSKREQKIKNITNEEVPNEPGESLVSRVKSDAKENNSILEGTLETHMLNTANEVTFPLSPPIQEKISHLFNEEKEWKRKEEVLVAEKMAQLEELEDYWNNKIHNFEEEQKKLYEEKIKNSQRNLEEELSKQSEKEIKVLRENLAKDMEDEKTAMEITLKKLKQDNAETLKKEQHTLNAELQEALHLLKEKMGQNEKMELEELEKRLKEDHKQTLTELETRLKEQSTKDLQVREEECLASHEEELKALEEKMSQMLKVKQETYKQEFQQKVNELKAEYDKNLEEERQSLVKNKVLSADSETLHLDVDHLKELHKSEMEAVEHLKMQKTILEKDRMQIAEIIDRQNTQIEEQRKTLSELQEQKFILQEEIIRHQKEMKSTKHFVDHLKRKSEGLELFGLKQGAQTADTLSSHVESEKMAEQDKNAMYFKDTNNPSSVSEDASNRSKLNSANESNNNFEKDGSHLSGNALNVEHAGNDSNNVSNLKIRVDSLENCMRLLESKLEKTLYLDAFRSRKRKDDINSVGFHNNSSHILHGSVSALPNATIGPGDNKNPMQQSFTVDALTVPSYSGGHILSASGDGMLPSCICDNGDTCIILHSLEKSLQTLYHSLHLPSWTVSVCNDHSTLSTSNLRSELHNFQQRLKEQKNNHQKTELKFKLTAEDFSCPSSQDSSSVLNDWLDKLPVSKIDSNAVIRAQKLIRREQKTRSPFTIVHGNKQNRQDHVGLFMNDVYDKNGYGEKVPPSKYFDTWPTFETIRKPFPTSMPSVHGTEYAYSYRYGEFPLPSSLPYTIERVKAEHEQWMARIDSMHQRIRNRERLSYITRTSLETSN